ncbi:hypothetical protein [Sinorhizobium meliloti]|uniref:hypothetical protein n=1 Tax=Rhizobium meliloti TaxID=382 RepID=UPI003D660930
MTYTMPLTLTAVDHDELCHGWSWAIEDEDHLVEQVARVALGQYRHIARILSGLSSRPATTTAEHVTDALAKLSPDADGSVWKRDGWLFQIISWIAAYQNRNGAIIRAPHIRKADHGFDGMQLELSEDGGAISAVVVFEDKATTNPRSTITSKVWPEMAKMEAGERITELTHDATSLLETQLGSTSGMDIDRAVEEIIWKEARRYRVSLTVSDEHQAHAARRGLFSGYNEQAAGDVIRRRAETICIPNMRSWMSSFSDRVKARIAELTPDV